MISKPRGRGGRGSRRGFFTDRIGYRRLRRRRGEDRRAGDEAGERDGVGDPVAGIERLPEPREPRRQDVLPLVLAEHPPLDRRRQVFGGRAGARARLAAIALAIAAFPEDLPADALAAIAGVLMAPIAGVQPAMYPLASLQLAAYQQAIMSTTAKPVMALAQVTRRRSVRLSEGSFS